MEHRENDPKMLLVTAMWCKYYWECEEYDKTICTLIDREGIARPANTVQMRRISNHAQGKRRQLIERAFKLEIPENIIEATQKRAMHYDMKRCKAEMNMIPDYIHTLNL